MPTDPTSKKSHDYPPAVYPSNSRSQPTEKNKQDSDGIKAPQSLENSDTKIPAPNEIIMKCDSKIKELEEALHSLKAKTAQLRFEFKEALNAKIEEAARNASDPHREEATLWGKVREITVASGEAIEKARDSIEIQDALFDAKRKMMEIKTKKGALREFISAYIKEDINQYLVAIEQIMNNALKMKKIEEALNEQRLAAQIEQIPINIHKIAEENEKIKRGIALEDAVLNIVLEFTHQIPEIAAKKKQAEAAREQKEVSKARAERDAAEAAQKQKEAERRQKEVEAERNKVVALEAINEASETEGEQDLEVIAALTDLISNPPKKTKKEALASLKATGNDPANVIGGVECIPQWKSLYETAQYMESDADVIAAIHLTECAIKLYGLRTDISHRMQKQLGAHEAEDEKKDQIRKAFQERTAGILNAEKLLANQCGTLAERLSEKSTKHQLIGALLISLTVVAAIGTLLALTNGVGFVPLIIGLIIVGAATDLSWTQFQKTNTTSALSSGLFGVKRKVEPRMIEPIAAERTQPSSVKAY